MKQKFTKTFALLPMAMAYVAVAAAPAESFNAAVSYPAQAAGMYSFALDGYHPTLIAKNVYASGGGVAYEDYYYGTRFEVIAGIPAVAQQSFKLSDWTIEDNYSGSLTDVATAIAYDYDRDRAYGCYYNEDGATFVFASVNIAYWGHTKIADLEKPWTGCAFDSKGTLYAIDSDGVLSTVDTATGKMTAVGNTGVVSDWITGAVIDPQTDTFYWSVKNDTESALYTVDLNTAKATKLYELENEEQMGGMYFPQTYDPKAPAKPSYGPSLSFSGTSLSGTVQFRAPSKTVDGSTGEGPLTYHIYANGEEVASGETSFGNTAYQKVNVELKKADKYCIAVTMSNEAGEGPRVKTTKFIGPDTPKAPSSCSVTWADGTATVSWYAVSSGANGGYIDSSSRHYRVTRYPGAVVVSDENLTTTKLTDQLPVPDERTEYYYTVECICGDLVSAPTKSASFSLGTILPPFEESFASSSSMIGWTKLNPGTDTRAWNYNSSGYLYVGTSAKPADSWIVTPAVKLEAGKSYAYSVDVKGYSNSYTEKFEVKVGSAPTVEAMTGSVIDATEFKSNQFATYTGMITPDADGVYYIGFHACSPSSSGNIYMDNVIIKEGVSKNAPAAATDLTAEADPSGAHKVKVSFTLPSVDLEGKTLSGPISKVDLVRDGSVVNSVTADLNGGDAYFIEDTENVPAGSHVYSVICYNADGKGAVSEEVTVFIGFAAPVAVENVNIAETENLGEVTVSWTAVTKDVSDKVLSANDVTYTILDKNGTEIETGLKDHSVTFRALPAEDHAFVQYLVKAVTEGGSSAVVKSELLPVGTPEATPYRESFAQKSISSPIGYASVRGEDPWVIIEADTDWGISPVDGDGGLAYLEGYANTISALFTGKIDISELESPALTFWMYNFTGSGDTNTNTMEIQIHNGSEFVSATTLVVDQTGEPNTWNKVVVPLNDFAGGIIRVKFIASVLDKRFFYIDDVRITSVTEYNLGVKNVSAPSTVAPGENYAVDVIVENLGTETAKGYKVELYADDELVDSKSGEALAPENETVITFQRTNSVFEIGAINYIAAIVYDPDPLQSDNVSDPVVVTVRDNACPEAMNLTGSKTDGKVELSWSEPDMTTAAPSAKVENFDLAQAWTSVVEGWSFIDNDKGIIGGIGSKKIPVSGQQSFFVMDRTYEALASGAAFEAHSGNRYLCSMYSMKGSAAVQSDDWAISPELYGGPQVVTLYASSFLADAGQPQYNETFEVLYSTTGRSIEDFKLVERFESIPAAWVKYSAYLPEGAKYFAIHAVSCDKYMLFIDDVNFIPAGGEPVAMTVNGYNVYRDGQKINDAVVSGTSYLDETVSANGKYRYAVTALYDAGESRPSNVIEIDMTKSGVDSIAEGGFSVSSADGMIVVAGAEGKVVSVVSVDGRMIASTVASGRLSVPVAPGVYVVTVDRYAVKIAVK